jgi:hypothetical protein
MKRATGLGERHISPQCELANDRPQMGPLNVAF